MFLEAQRLESLQLRLLDIRLFLIKKLWSYKKNVSLLRIPGKVLTLDRLHASDPEPAGPGVHPLVDAVHVVAPISHILKQGNDDI